MLLGPRIGGRCMAYIIRRIAKFYSNFWVVLLLMLPIGIIGFHRPLVESASISEISKVWIREIFAISGHSSYNPSWWFNALIIEFYLLFPLLYYGLRYAFVPTILFVLLQRHLVIAPIKVDMHIYLPIFVVGMAWAMYTDKITKWGQFCPRWLLYIAMTIGLLIPAIILPMMDDGSVYAKGIRQYGILTIALTMLIVFLNNTQTSLGRCLAFLGKHSSNIYWMHTLIFYYWFPQFFYALHNPILIFMTLIGGCLLLSIGIEWIKEVSQYNKQVYKILHKFE